MQKFLNFIEVQPINGKLDIFIGGIGESGDQPVGAVATF